VKVKKRGAEGEEETAEHTAVGEVEHQPCDEGGHREQEAHHPEDKVTADGPHRRDEHDRDHGQEHGMSKGVGGEERLDDGQ